MNALKMRNLTSHTYNQATLQALLDYIDHSFQHALRRLYHYLKGELRNTV